jgi:hypothetical protein
MNLENVIGKALALNTCPTHHFGYRWNPHWELFCHRCGYHLTITPDIKKAIDIHYSLTPTAYEEEFYALQDRKRRK